jgi:hypothetical protein
LNFRRVASPCPEPTRGGFLRRLRVDLTFPLERFPRASLRRRPSSPDDAFSEKPEANVCHSREETRREGTSMSPRRTQSVFLVGVTRS